MASSLDKLKARSAAAGAIPGEREIEVPLERIRFDPKQPRKTFHALDGLIPKSAEDWIAEMAGSIAEQGLIQAITLQEQGDGTYLVVVGETRVRAHLKLGRTTIRAKVRNDLTDPGKLLIFRLAENVSRQDLTEDELANSIRELIQGSEEIKPMTQVQVATFLSKSEGWVTRYVKFGDEELQRLWVQTGIADTVEKVYRMSILPTAIQVDIQRRVGLPADHPDFLEKPLNRSVIDELAREAKRAKAKPSQPPTSAFQSRDVYAGPQSQVNSQLGAEPLAASTNGVSEHDLVGQALANAAADGQPHTTALSTGPSAQQAKYTLDPAARAALQGLALQANDSEKSTSGDGVREPARAPVNCRVSVGSLIALLQTVAQMENNELLEAMHRVHCELLIPGSIASLLVNGLTGVVVDHKEVPATLQSALAKFN